MVLRLSISATLLTTVASAIFTSFNRYVIGPHFWCRETDNLCTLGISRHGMTAIDRR